MILYVSTTCLVAQLVDRLADVHCRAGWICQAAHSSPSQEDVLVRLSLQTPSVASRKELPEPVLYCEKVSSAPLGDRASSHKTNPVHTFVIAHFMFFVRKIRANSYLDPRECHLLRAVHVFSAFGDVALFALFVCSISFLRTVYSQIFLRVQLLFM